MKATGIVRKIDDFSNFWNEMQNKKQLTKLEENLDRYNKISGVQPTNCLAYVQRMLNIEKEEKE